MTLPVGLVLDAFDYQGNSLGTITEAFDKSIRLELNGPGEGLFTVNRVGLSSTLLRQGNLVKVKVPEWGTDYLFAFWLETAQFDLVSSEEQGGQNVKIGGRGALAYLDRAMWWTQSFTQGVTAPSVILGTASTGNRPGQLLKLLVDEWKHASRPQHPLPLLTHDFTYAVDSSGAAWTPVEGTAEFTAYVGEKGLSQVGKLLGTGVLDVYMGPDLKLRAFNHYGTDRSGAFGAGKVRFEAGINLASGLTREVGLEAPPTHEVVGGKDDAYGFGTLPDAATRPTVEQYITSDAAAPTVLDAQALADLQARLVAAEGLGFNIPVGNTPLTGRYRPGPPTAAWAHFWLGDDITVHTGTGSYDYNATRARVTGITLSEDGAGNIDCVVQCGAGFRTAGGGSQYGTGVAVATGGTPATVAPGGGAIGAPPTDGSGGGYTPDTTPPSWATPPGDGLVLNSGTILQTDGSLRPYLQADWNPVVDADLDHYQVQIVASVQQQPVLGGTGWTATATGTGGTLPVGGYIVGVAAYGDDGGESMGQTLNVEVTTLGQNIVVTGLPGSVAGMADLAPSFAIYVCPVEDGDPRFLADTAAATYTITSIPSAGARTMKAASDAFAWGSVTTIERNVLLSLLMEQDVQGGVIHHVRVRAFDHAGNPSAWSGAKDYMSARDGDAPAIPTGVTAAAGYRMVGLRWGRSDAPDLDRYQVRVRQNFADASNGEWTQPQNVYANFAAVPDLDTWEVEPKPPDATHPDGTPGVAAQYEFQVRAVDRSGNVEVSPGPPQTIGQADDVTVGWSASANAIMSAIAPEDLAVDQLFANYATLIELSATNITTGTLTLAPDPNSADAIVIWADAAKTIMAGYWSPNGWYIIDPANRNRAIRGMNGAISFTNQAYYPPTGEVWQTPEPLWNTAISADGIAADYITTGNLPGGYNRLLNSGFELHPRAVPGNFTWNTIAEWDTASPATGGLVGAATNKSTGLATYKQAKYQYTDV